MRAKDYFEGIRAEVVSTDRAREMLERMKAREGAKTQSYQAGSGHGTRATRWNPFLSA